MRLDAFLAASARTPFAWGRQDCCLWPADWLVSRGLADPAADWRGRYRTQLGATRLLKRLGGVRGAAQAMAAQLRLQPTDTPIAGDVGVIAVTSPAGRTTDAGAICLGRRWAMLAPAGLLIAEATPISAWRV